MFFFCINLEKRSDKKKLSEKEFKKANIDVIFHKAIEHRISYFGCTLSHKDLIKKALKNKWDYFCVFEDDVQINNPKKFISDICNAVKNLPLDWHILYLGGLIGRGGKLKKINKYIYKVQKMMCTYGIIYNRKSYKNILNGLPEDKRNIDENDITRNGHQSIDGWLATEYQKKFPCYVTSNFLVYERKNKSDIELITKKTKNWYKFRFIMFKYGFGGLLNYVGHLVDFLHIKNKK